MTAARSKAAPGFLERVGSVLERVEYRRAATAQEKELVYQTRYTALARQNLVRFRADGLLFDKIYDNSPNHHNIMTFIDDDFASTFRIHVDSGPDAILPSLEMFGDVLEPVLREGRTVVDLSRIAAKREFAQRFPELPYITMRVVWLAAEHFQADVITATCFGEHQAYYTRMFGLEALCEPRQSPEINRALVCMALDCRAKKRSLETRYPLFRSTEAERQSLYGSYDSLPAQAAIRDGRLSYHQGSR